MNDGTPTEPDATPTPTDPDGQPTPGSADPTVAWTNPAASEPSPPSATAGLISAAPVGWTGQDIGGPPAGGAPSWRPAHGAAPSPAAPTSVDPAAPAPAGPVPTAPPVSWQPPSDSDRTREVPGAPGLVFAGTFSRFIAYVIDTILLVIVAAVIAWSLGFGTTVTETIGGRTSFVYTPTGPEFAVAITLLSLAYDVFFWTGGRRATPGQRIFHFQVGNAFDGRGLTLSQAVRRWFFLGSAFGLAAFAPAIEGTVTSVATLWMLVLLLSTVLSPTRQGLHDRIANSAVVRPAGQSSSGLVTACVVVMILILVAAIISIVALILAGGRVTDLLLEMGRSI